MVCNRGLPNQQLFVNQAVLKRPTRQCTCITQQDVQRTINLPQQFNACIVGNVGARFWQGGRVCGIKEKTALLLLSVVSSTMDSRVLKEWWFGWGLPFTGDCWGLLGTTCANVSNRRQKGSNEDQGIKGIYLSWSNTGFYNLVTVVPFV